MCRVLDVSVSGYYQWTQRSESNRSQETRKVKEAIRTIHKENREIYGSPRIAVCLQEQGYHCSRQRTARLMRSMGLRSKVAKKFKVTTNSKHKEPIAHNFIDQVFEADFINDAWTSDLTYVWTGAGWLYLTVIMDLYNREIIGHSFSKRMTAETTVNPALDMALMHRRPARGVVFHSDRGIQYASKSFRLKLTKHALIQSMSGKGNCYDNAVTESFFKTLKTELVYTERYRTREEARHSLFEYIEVFYNRQRKHSYLGYKSPVDFLQQQTMAMAS